MNIHIAHDTKVFVTLREKKTKKKTMKYPFPVPSPNPNPNYNTIYNKNWAQYEYSYNLANSRENWAQKNKLAAGIHVRRESFAPMTPVLRTCCLMTRSRFVPANPGEMSFLMAVVANHVLAETVLRCVFPTAAIAEYSIILSPRA